jgi:hypothetical protein
VRLTHRRRKDPVLSSPRRVHRKVETSGAELMPLDGWRAEQRERGLIRAHPR